MHRAHPPVFSERRGGFALLITITLLAFLVLLLVSLASLTRVETQVASNNQNIAQARQNALLALNIALGQLQRHTGPDQRVSARADLVLPESVAAAIAPPTFNLGSGDQTSTGTTGAQAAALVENHWAAPASPRNRHWTGVWHNTTSAPYTPNSPVAFNPIPSAPVWLVSGSETPSPSDPNNPVTGLAVSSSALDDTLIDSVSGATHRLLIGPATTGATAAADLHRFVTAPQVPILATGVPGTAANTSAIVGHYAWWVGDEGIKARVNLVDPYAPAPTASPITAPQHPDNIARRLSAQRLAAEAIAADPASSNAALAGLAPFFTTNPGDATRIRISDTNINAVLSPRQFTYLLDDAVFREQLARRHHDISTTSRGVLADVKNGGLKRDLTHILSRKSDAEFRTALNTVSNGTPAYNVAPLATGNIALSPASTPYAEFPTAAYAGLLDYSATWEQLWSHYNLGQPTDASPPGAIDADVLQARLPTRTRQGITPLFVQGKLFYRLRYSGGTLHVDTWPLVVLANPYPKPLSGEFLIRFNMGSDRVRIRSGAPVNPSSPVASEFSNLGNDNLPNGYLGAIQLVVQATSIPPGEAQIFTISPAANTDIANKDDAHVVHMVNDYDPTAFMTYNTGKPLPSGHTHIALFLSNDIKAYAAIGADTAENRFATIITRESNEDADASVSSGFAVQPFEAVEGAEQYGGGAFFTLHDGFSKDPQQSPFAQLNYRAYTTANYSGGDGHPLQWATKFFLEGLPGSAGPDPRMAANLLPPSGTGIPKTTRWGLVSTGDFPEMTTLPAAINQPAHADLGFVNILYDIPRADLPISSIGQLQHFNLAGHLSPSVSDIKPAGWQLNYAVANSYATPRVTRDAIFSNQPVLGRHYDGAFLWNDVLWDRFTFSTFPPFTNFDFDDPDHKLVNARYRPFRDRSLVPADDESQFRGLYEAATNLLVEGAFNVNSTSVEAWKAVLSGLKDIPVGSDTSSTNLTAPFTRTLEPTGGATGSKAGDTANAWNGVRNLTHDELHRIAEEMVLQVRLRGPFLSMAEFVNRRLSPGRPDFTDPEAPDRQRLGISGALQAAIDRVINQPSDITNAQFNTKTRAWTTAGDKNPYYGDVDYRASTRIAGFPGHLLQGDVLSALGATLTARSDTFTIRTYGDVANPVTNVIEGRAWCEAVVQRLPDHVDPNVPAADTPPASSPAATFGRRYQIVSFRWLTPSDI